jgi:hypothetical protein
MLVTFKWHSCGRGHDVHGDGPLHRRHNNVNGTVVLLNVI